MEGLGKLPRSTRGVKKSVVVTKHESCDFVEKYYELVSDLGGGSFGKVWMVRDRNTGAERVCKVVSMEGLQQDVLDMLRMEVALLCALDHPHIVKIFEYAITPVGAANGELVIVMEHLAGGDCLKLLQDSLPGMLSEGLVARLIHQVFLALCYCHAEGILHRDIKPDNMMLIEEDLLGVADCKLIDFGVSTRSNSDERGIFGTLSHIAPEVAGQTGCHIYTDKADVWSTGVTTFQLLTGMLPFGRPTISGGVQAGLHYISSFEGFDEDLGQKLQGHPGWENRTPECQQFVRWLLAADPAKRPGCSEILEHPWMQMHKAETSNLTQEMVQSLVSYPLAPPLVRCCLYAIAARKGAPDMERFGAAFLRMDRDGTGMLSRDDLALALARTGVNVDSLLSTADLSHTGGISYTEFIAACLYARYVSRGSLEHLMQSAFEALDSDRDGLVHIDEIRVLFRERDAPFLERLPQNQPFNLIAWNACLQACGIQDQSANKNARPQPAAAGGPVRSAVASAGYQAQPAPMAAQVRGPAQAGTPTGTGGTRTAQVRFTPQPGGFAPLAGTPTGAAGTPTGARPQQRLSAQLMANLDRVTVRQPGSGPLPVSR